MFKQGDKVTVQGRQGVWLVKDADERFNNCVMMVHLQEDSGFVLLAVHGSKCNKVSDSNSAVGFNQLGG